MFHETLLKLAPQAGPDRFSIRGMCLTDIRVGNVSIHWRIIAAKSSTPFEVNLLQFGHFCLYKLYEFSSRLGFNARGDLLLQHLVCSVFEPDDRHPASLGFTERSRLHDTVLGIPKIWGVYDADHRLAVTHGTGRPCGAAFQFTSAIRMLVVEPTATAFPRVRPKNVSRRHATSSTFSANPSVLFRAASRAGSSGALSSKWTEAMPGASANM